ARSVSPRPPPKAPEMPLLEQVYALAEDDSSDWLDVSLSALQQMLERCSASQPQHKQQKQQQSSPGNQRTLLDEELMVVDDDEEELDPEDAAGTARQLQQLVNQFKSFMQAHSDFSGVEPKSRALQGHDGPVSVDLEYVARVLAGEPQE